MADNSQASSNASGDAGPPIAESPKILPGNVVVPELETDSSSKINDEPACKKTSESKEDESDGPQMLPNLELGNKEPNEIAKLELEIQQRTRERDDYQMKLAETEKKLSALQASFDAVTSGGGDEITLRREVEHLKNNLTQAQLMLNDRGRLIANQETQINALTQQVTSLKEVISITKDLLNIRNVEVKHLQNDVDTMESKITLERERHKIMLNKMDSAVRLNADLKQEYETQLRLFQDLRGKYEQKVELLSEENRALEAASQAVV